MSLLVTGSIGIDNVITPHGAADEVLGGSAAYFSLAASLFGPVRLVAVVGEDFPSEFRKVLASANVDLAGLEVRSGSKTFRWTGKYSADMNDRDTLEVQLNVLEERAARVPESFADSRVVFLANTHPTLQRETLQQVDSPMLSVCDTMDLWITTEYDELCKTLRSVDGALFNDAEIRQFTGKTNLVAAGRAVLDMGPRFTVIKKGEHGCMLVTAEGLTVIPAFPTPEVVDPTGAGDSFAGGMLGYLASVDEVDHAALRRALVRGTVAASYTVETFSLDRLRSIGAGDIEQRCKQFRDMLRID